MNDDDIMTYIAGSSIPATSIQPDYRNMFFIQKIVLLQKIETAAWLTDQ